MKLSINWSERITVIEGQISPHSKQWNTPQKKYNTTSSLHEQDNGLSLIQELTVEISPNRRNAT